MNAKNNTKNKKHYLDNLIKFNPKTINVIIKNNKSFSGVYAISDRYDNEIIYVGESSQVKDRLYHHIHGTNNSDLKQKTGLSSEELKWYKVRYRQLKDDRKRKMFESYVIGVLEPILNL